MRAVEATAAAAIICVLVAITSCNPIAFKDCGSVSATLSTVDVKGCTAFPCPLVKGTNASVQVTFTMKTTTQNATSSVDGIIAGVPVPFPLPNPNGCVDSGLTCPLAAGSSNIFDAAFPILNAYPEIQLVVKWVMTDDQGTTLFCFLFPVKIVAASQRVNSIFRNLVAPNQ